MILDFQTNKTCPNLFYSKGLEIKDHRWVQKSLVNTCHLHPMFLLMKFFCWDGDDKY